MSNSGRKTSSQHSGGSHVEMSDIEGIKENLDNSLKSGYRAKDLERLTKSSTSVNAFERERRLKLQNLTSIQNKLQDLGPFIEYIEWTKMHFPTGHASIMKITEDAVRKFRKDDRYKNDARYVELWMSVGKKQQDPSDLFKYLITNNIGLQCALFYEEYAGYKESMNCFDQAEEIYRLGINRKAGPLARLVRQFDAFLIRQKERSDEAKASPNASLSNSRILAELDLPPSLQMDEDDDEVAHPMPNRRFSIHPPPLSKSKKTTAPKKSKLTVFKDTKEPSMSEILFPPEKPNNDAEYDTRPVPKENVKEAEKWNGSTLPQNMSAKSAAKMNVFRDDQDEDEMNKSSKRANKKVKTMLQPSQSQPKESIFMDDTITFKGTSIAAIPSGAILIANTQLCYLNGTEYSFEENRAALCHKNELEGEYSSEEAAVQTPGKSIRSKEGPSPWHNQKKLTSPEGDKGAIQDIFKMFEEDASKLKSENSDEEDIPPPVLESRFRPASPTFHTKNAMKMIDDMFNNPIDEAPSPPVPEYRVPTELEDEGGRVIVYNPEDDETISRKVYKRPVSASGPLKLGVFKDELSDEDQEMNEPVEHRQSIQSTPFFERPVTNMFGNPVHVMTPVTECSDRTQSYTIASASTAPPSARPSTILEENEELDNTMLFLKGNNPGRVEFGLAHVAEEAPEEKTLEPLSFSNPVDPTHPSIRQSILSRTLPTSDCNVRVLTSMKSHLGHQLAHANPGYTFEMESGSEEYYKLVERIESSDYYHIISEAESKDCVLHIQSPTSVWEYYILVLLHSKASVPINSIVAPQSCHLFKNESITRIDYISGGSLLDAIKKIDYLNGQSIPEVVAAFWTLQMISILETIHSLNIIHGDFSINNLMIEGSNSSNIKDKFNLILTDFSAAIDISAFNNSEQTFVLPSSTKSSLTNNDEIESLECWEFRNGAPWTLEPDWYNAANVIHELIFGTPLTITENYTGLAKSVNGVPQKPFIEINNILPVQWNGEIWGHAFTTLLNLSHTELESDINPLAELKQEFQTFVDQHDHLLRDAFATLDHE